ncbi:MAG: CotH kinase family protein, partial [Tepidisphaeraceae bacterium]
MGTTWTQPSFDDASWASGPTGLGFANTVNGFATTLYRGNIGLGSVENAETVIDTTADQISTTNQTESVLNFMDTGGGGHFYATAAAPDNIADNAFPGMTIGEGLSNIVLQATGTLQVSAAQAGYYTFGVNSDDGFMLSLSGANFSNGAGYTTCGGTTLEYDGGRGASDTLGTTYLAAGSYPLSLVYFQGGGGDSMEFYAAKESSSAGATSFDANSILVGNTTATTASGGTSTTTTPLVVTSPPFSGTSSSGEFSAAVATNVKPAVEAAIAAAGGTSLYTRIDFNAANYAALSTLMLKMQYDDGYVAYLNGVKVASANAPASPTWNSPANEEQTSDVQATTYEDIDLSSFLNSATTGHLAAAGNVLAIQVLMSSPTDGDMLVVPELAQVTSVLGGQHVFATPTPGAANTLGDAAPDITFSTTHGFFYASFDVALTSNVPGSIYYTTDNSAPAVQALASITYSGTTATATTQGPVDFQSGNNVQISNATPAVYDGTFAITVTGTNTFTYTLPSTPSANANGTAITATEGRLYSGPVLISTTTDLQAVIIAGGNVGAIQCETYIFPAAVINQPAAPPGFPTTWNGTINGESTAADYAMSSVPGYTPAQVESALTSLPTFSLVTTNANLFSTTGMYSNSLNKLLESPASLEFFNTLAGYPNAGTTDFSSLIGLSLNGGYGRYPQFLKHGFQIAFDQPDGASAMEPIFGDGYMADNLIFRQGFNDSWSGGGTSAQYIVDQWTRNTLTALGDKNSAGIWVQLYVNGLYWGLYNVCEHIDPKYAAYFYGGNAADYDVYHDGSSFDVKGSMTGWNDLFNVARYGNVAGTGTASITTLANPTAYALMATYLNLPDFCDYIITNYYGSNWDWDWHNFSALYDTAADTGFIFQDWDGEGMIR